MSVGMPVGPSGRASRGESRVESSGVGAGDPLRGGRNTYHVVHRRDKRQSCFSESPDYVRYQDSLLEALLRWGVALHAYVLMANHVHLLMTPESPDSIPRVMGLLNNCIVASVNKQHGRAGPPFEGRYRASLIDCERELFHCYRYIELNPVRAGIVEHPGAYFWSSYASNALGVADELVSPHPHYQNLGATQAMRCAAYRAYYRRSLDGTPVDTNCERVLKETRPGRVGTA